MCTASIFEARNNLSEYVKMAEKGEPVELTRYNKPVAVIISYEEYEETKPEKSSLLETLQKIKEEYADVLDDEGIPLPPKVYLDPNRKIFED
ncbi:MAG: type II toxin-antitoxin system Phd/YefM family antitoxin [Treponema sp.]|nr:type II toxin-antitoxin system Phd/YefM family antitoxin [Treponema sp.]